MTNVTKNAPQVKAPATAAKPKKMVIGTLYARVVRGPRNQEGSLVAEWYWRAERHDGGTKTVWSGWGTADQVRKRLAGLVATGQDTGAHDNHCTTVADLMALWLGDIQRRPLAQRTKELYAGNCSHIVRQIGKTPLASCGPLTAQQLELGLVGIGQAPRTAQQVAQSFVSAWRWGQDMRLCPAQVIRLGRLGERKLKTDCESTYTPEQWWAILDHLWGSQWYYYCRLLEATGARPDEINNITWGDIDPQTPKVRIRVSKTGPRTIPLPQDLWDEILALRVEGDKDDQRLWSTSIENTTHSLRDAIRRAATALGLPYYPPKQMRHLAVDRLYRSGADVASAAAMLGHSPETALRHYRRVSEDDKAKALALAGLGQRPAPGPARLRLIQ